MPRSRRSSTPPAHDGETERRLFEAALDVFSAKGYAAASVRDIVERAGFSLPVVYYYCENKADLFRRLVTRLHTDSHAALERLASGPEPPESALRAFARGSFAFCAADPRVPRLMFQSAYGPPNDDVSSVLNDLGGRRFALVVQMIERGISSGLLAPADPFSLALAFCALVDHHLNVLSRLPHPQALLTPDRADALVDLFLHGAAAREHPPQRPPLPPNPPGQQ